MSLTIDQIERRRLGIGGSDAAKILGLSNYCGPVKLARQKRGDLPDDDVDTRQTRYGSWVEGFIRDEFERETGLLLVDRPLEVVHPEHDWLRGNVDGWVQDTDGSVCVLELKTAAWDDPDNPSLCWGDNGTDDVPMAYKLQVWHYLLVTGAPRAFVCVWLSGRELRWYRIERDEKRLAALFEKEREFWGHVVAGTDPEPSDYADVRVRFDQVDAGTTLDASDSERVREAVTGYLRAADDEKQAKARKEACASILYTEAGDHEAVAIGDHKVATLKEQTSRRIDSKALRERFPEAATACEKVTTGRVLRLTKHAKEL